ncbi:uncharacterized protein LOC112597992 [Melanaphis sacchari]|uniref:uncharacterized protein LOC112597992 n=1 Tax=Melanaphis sacchari TaxID=742174 RepID=UPI000DC14484|nr:uncharacterized protein LOC112597992 [Melanaphis sacchari]
MAMCFQTIMSLKLICVATLATVIPMSAFNHSAAKKESEFNKFWETSMKQEEFDGMPLPENSDLPTSTQITPAVVNIGQRYGVPYTQLLGKKKHHSPGKKDDIMEHVVGASLISGGTLFSLGALSMVIMASKALLFAFGAIMLTCLSSGWISGWHKSGDKAGTVYEVVAKPQITHGHSYSSEVHHEPYTAGYPQQQQQSIGEYYNGYPLQPPH